jgi:proliferating cell nuclear antigen
MTELATTTDLSEYNFHLWTSKTPPIKYLSELLRDLLTEGNLECNEDGIKLLSVDPTRTVLVHLKLFASKFEEYQCEKPIVLGLNLEDFFKIIKNMETLDTLRLFVEKDNENHIGIERYNKEENITNTIYLSLMDIPLYERSIPPAKFESVIVLSSQRFQRICREISQFSDKIEITSVGSQLIFKGYNTNVKQGIKVKPAASGMKYETNDNPNQIIQGVFDLKHLVQFSKCANLSQTIRIHIKNDFPLIIQCEVATMGVIKLCLAPQSEE